MKTMNHNMGKNSFDQIRAREKKMLGRNPSRVDMCKHCYSKKNGEPSNSAITSKMNEMEEEVSKLPHGTKDCVGPKDIFAKVVRKDKHGQVQILFRCLPK
ncbi:hypothetical protein ACH5RR_029350 [Cinchona calisaya]|uniref:Uncharacterized protein n=1 Tax=Cinchona calisaya TaxID=153742 RepID=A0ABD2YUT2_9GENT